MARSGSRLARSSTSRRHDGFESQSPFIATRKGGDAVFRPRLHALAADESRQPETVAGVSLFRSQIEPILTNKCLTCHSGDKKKGQLDLSRRDRALVGGKDGPALVPGMPAKSLLYQKLSAGEMPPQ